MDKYARVRANLHELKHKLSTSVCKIAYMGSSVTVQKEGYRIFLQQYLREYFHQEHLEICAAIGGVGAITGVFTMDEDVINYAPDLCFIEYMVSDRIEDNTPQTEIGKVIEGIVRKLRKIGCQIIFLYRYVEKNLIDDRYRYALGEYEKIAQHYQINSIDFGGYIQAVIDRQQYTHTDLFKDHTHTNLSGSKAVADYIAKMLLNILAENDHNTANIIDTKHEIEPIYNDNYENTKVVYLDENFLSNKSSYTKGLCSDKVKNHQSKHKDYQYIEIASDNSFKFKIKGSLIGLMLIVGRDSGVIDVSTKKETDKVLLWDQWCHYDRFSTIILLKEYPEMTEVEIAITDEAIDYSTCRREIVNPEQIVKKLKLVGIMTRDDTRIIPSSSPSQSADIPELIQSAKRFAAQQNDDKALSLYLKAARIAPNRRACMALAKYIIEQKERQESNLHRVFTLYPNPIFVSNLGDIFYELKEFDLAVKCLRQAISINPRLAEDCLPIMYAAKQKQNQQNEAIRLYKEWIENYYIINHQHKIIYCPIPKNACTLFKQAIVENSEYKTDFQQSGLDIHRYVRQNDINLANFAYLEDPEYLKIAIIRNPGDRLVSAYLNKFVRHKKPTPIVKNIIKDVYRSRDLKPDYQISITFEDFIQYLATTEDCYLNEHWRSQYFFLGMGLLKFDLFESLENSDRIIKTLASARGIKIENKKTKNKTNYGEDLADRSWHQVYPPELRQLKQLPTADSLYTPELVELVKNRYARDWEVYHNHNSANSLITNKLS